MPHVDEGLLHAWLDGAFPAGSAVVADIEAHLAACADCRARLDEARALKDRAVVVLRHAAPPDVRVPPFEEVSARRHGGHAVPTARRAWLPPARLAWAASVMLALGAGWIANELARDGEVPRFDMLQDVAQTSSPQPLEQDRAASVGSAVPASGGQSEAFTTESATGVPREVQRFGRTGTESLVTAADAAADESRTAGAAMRDSMVLDAPVGGLQALTKTAAESVRNAYPGPARAVMPGAPAPSLDARAAGGVPHVSSAAELIAPEARAAVDARTLDDATRLLNDYFAAFVRNTWRPESPGVVRDRLGQDLAAIQGVEQRSTELAEVDGRSIARTQFRLDGGAILELVQQARVQQAQQNRQEAARFRDAAEPTPSAIPLAGLDRTDPRFAGLAAVLVRRESGVLLLTGPIPRDSLGALATRIR